MSMLVAWVAYPLVLLAFCLGLGLLVDVLSGRRLPGVLLAPVGLAAMIVAGQFTTHADATAELTMPLLAALAVLGAALSIPWRFARPDLFPLLAGFGVFAVFGAPVILSGDPTFAGYIKLDDTATWFALTDRAMEHGRSLEGLAPSTYWATLDFTLGASYPIGVFIPFGVASQVVGGDLAWVFQPYVSFLAAMLALCLWQIAGAVGRFALRPSQRALAAFIAAQPALLFGYALWGGVKEVAAALFVALAAALAPGFLRANGAATSAALPALPAAALVGVLSLGGLVWLGPMLLVLAVFALRRPEPSHAARSAAAFGLPLAVFVIPIVFAGGFNPFQSVLTEESEIGNLIESLSLLQVLGIWPSADFRVAPEETVAAAVLIALGALAAVYGFWITWRGRDFGQLLLASTMLAAVPVIVVGSPWVDAKALAIVAPAGLSLAIVGAIAGIRLDRPTGVALVAVVIGGVLWSNVLAYGGVSLAPYEQLRELERIGERHAGEGPALMTEYNPYGARHFLRELDAEGASELRFRQVPLVEGGTPEKGESVDTERIEETALYEYRTLVLRRSPLRSRPPSVYRLVSSGDYYEVWQRPRALEGLPPERLRLGGRLDPAAVPKCSEVGGLGLLALARGARGVRLLAAPAKPLFYAGEGPFSVPRDGRYEAWLLGSVRGTVALDVDGRRVGDVRHELNNEGSFIALGQVRLRRGVHRASLDFGGADLHPGSGGLPWAEPGPLIFVPAADEAGGIVAVDVGESERLCGRRWDWIEAVGRL